MPATASLADLGRFDSEQWRDWLRRAIGQWFVVSVDPLDVLPGDAAAKIRREAFFPFLVSPRSEDPARDLATAIESALGGEVPAAGRGVGLLLDEWQVAADGAEAGAFAISLGVELATRSLALRVQGILDRPLIADSRGRKALIDAIVYAVCERGSRTSILEVARSLHAKDLLTPEAAARMLPQAAADSIASLAALVAEFCPALVGAPLSDPAVRQLGHTMRATSKIWRAAPTTRRKLPEGDAAALERVQQVHAQILGSRDAPSSPASVQHEPGHSPVDVAKRWDTCIGAMREKIASLLSNEQSRNAGSFLALPPNLLTAPQGR